MERDITAVNIFSLAILGVVSLVAFLGNGFIIVVLGHRWVQSRKMVPCDLLLISLSTSRFLLQLVVMMSQFLYFITPQLDAFRFEVWSFVWIYFNISSFWCIMWLIVFYCLKIITFVHPLLLKLKARINALVPQLIGMSLTAFTVFYFSLLVTSSGKKKYYIPTGNLTGNTSQEEVGKSVSFGVLHYLNFVLTAISFTICVAATILLLLSLWRHTRTLKKCGIGLKDLSTQAHTKVITHLLSFLFFYILYFTLMMLSMMNMFKFGKVERTVSDIGLSSYPSAHSIILILTNPKLKEAFVRMLNIKQRAS